MPFQNFVVPLRPIWRTQQRKVQAQMAESVDALVSNTSGATRAGSTPALGTTRALQSLSAASPRSQHFFISPKGRKEKGERGEDRIRPRGTSASYNNYLSQLSQTCEISTDAVAHQHLTRQCSFALARFLSTFTFFFTNIWD